MASAWSGWRSPSGTLLRNVNLKLLPGFIEDRLDDVIAETLAQNPGARHFFPFVERGGWFAADRLVAWLKTKLDSGPWKGGQRQFSGMTLARFFASTQVDLSVVASDTSDGRLLVLNHRTAPDCPVVRAVRMSMSIPLVGNEVTWSGGMGWVSRAHAHRPCCR